MQRNAAYGIHLGRAVDELRSRGETIPELPDDFVAAQQAIRGQVFKARPLYLGIEPASGVTPRELAALEQVIGDSILAVRAKLTAFLAEWCPDCGVLVSQSGIQG